MKPKSKMYAGRISTFGGAGDSGVSPSEGLAILTAKDVSDPKYFDYFALEQPVGTTGTARRLDAKSHYIAMRWAYTDDQVGFDGRLDITTPMAWLRTHTVTVSANGKSIEAQPADWGPHISTGRIADLSPGLALALGLNTDDNATITILVN